MKIQAGDRVRFLNAVGGGEVARYISKDVIGVVDKDGFEIPVLVKECVVVGEVSRMNFPVQPQKSAPEPVSIPVETKPAPPEKPEWEESEETDYGDALSLYIGIVPVDVKNLSTTPFDIFLINDSNYTLLFLVQWNHPLFRRGKGGGFEHGEVYPNTKLFLETIDHEQLQKSSQLLIQAIAFKKEKAFEAKPVIDCVVSLPVLEMNKLHSFMENDFFDEEAIILPVIEKDAPPAFLKIDAKALKQAMQQKDAPATPKPKPEHKRQRISPVIEIDLHINQLLDSTAGMSNGDMLNYQMDKFVETIEQYKTRKGQKLVFIHGKGDGVLRNEIVKTLKTKYKTFYFQDASFREYGFGATMVTIR